MRYVSTKTYGHEIGLSACFRQWRAQSHCRFLHGYALAFRFEFEAEKLDEHNWVVDFGSLQLLKAELERFFDHKTVVANDDPSLPLFREMEAAGLGQLVVMPNVGCEAFARVALALANDWLHRSNNVGRVRVRSVECREHGANSAIVEAT